MVAADGTAARTAAAVQMAENSADLDELDWKLEKGLAEMHSPVHFDRHSHAIDSADAVAGTFERKPDVDATWYVAQTKLLSSCQAFE